MEQTRLGTDLIRKQSIKTIDSREVAEIMQIGHWEVLRKLKGIIKTLTDNKIVVSKYFIESTYKDTSGKKNSCYQLTKMGCEFIANKFNGEKGILFTAKYVERFNEMEEVIKQPKTAFDLLELQFKAIKETRDQINQVNFKTLETRKELKDFKEDIPLFGIEMDELQALVRKKGIEVLGGKRSAAYKDKSIRTQIYSDIQRELKRQFGVNKYKAIKRRDLELAKKIVTDYKAPLVLVGEIEVLNSQLNLKV